MEEHPQAPLPPEPPYPPPERPIGKIGQSVLTGACGKKEDRDPLYTMPKDQPDDGKLSY